MGLEVKAEPEVKTEVAKEKVVETKAVKSVSPNKIIPKRRGLKIVKKKKPKVEPVATVVNHSSSVPGQQPKKAMKSLSEILGGNDNSNKEETSTLKVSAKKKEKKKTVAKSHDHGKVIEL